MNPGFPPALDGAEDKLKKKAGILTCKEKKRSPMRVRRISFVVLMVIAALACGRCRAQAALLMEEPYGFFGAMNPTGHNAIYFQRICAQTPVTLRRCQPGEMGAVIARYQGIAGYDWVAIPLIPYLYSVESADDVPAHVNHELVDRLRDRYHEAHLESLGPDVSPGNFIHGGWKQLIGVAYERRIYAFTFATSEADDDALIAQLNDDPNHSHFNLLFANCADFARKILDSYFPGKFHRSFFPDVGMTTPKQIAYKLVRYGHKHPDAQVEVFEIPQVPGYRRMSHANKSIDESFVTTLYAIPITIVNPYLTGGLLVDYLFRGRHHIIPRHHPVLGPDDLDALTGAPSSTENPSIADEPITNAPSGSPGVTSVSTELQTNPSNMTATQ
jgi:hypothetical protein